MVALFGWHVTLCDAVQILFSIADGEIMLKDESALYDFSTLDEFNFVTTDVCFSV